MIFDPKLMWLIGTGLTAGGAAWGAVKTSLNGTKKRVEKLEQSTTDVRERLVRVETKIDSIKDGLSR